MNKLISPKTTALTFGILVICFVVAFYVVAWQEPTEVPPGGNVPAPLNVGSDGQTKEGGLTINGVLETLQDMIVNLVTIKGNGDMSPNLNSDRVDDFHAADLMAQTGGGGGAFTRWGATSCPSGWAVAYTGKGFFPFISSTNGIGASDVICSSGLSGSGSYVSGLGGGWSDGQKFYGPGYYMLCAVCIK